jgi:NADH dehydrogenase FAD-containing subunit
METNTSTPHIAILGAGYAGQMAAARIAKRRPDIRLTVIDASSTFVERIRLHQIAAAGRAQRPTASHTGARTIFEWADIRMGRGRPNAHRGDRRRGRRS